MGWPFGPLGSASTRRGTWRLTRVQSSTVGRAQAGGDRRWRAGAESGWSSRRRPRAPPWRCAPRPSVRMSRMAQAARFHCHARRAPSGAPCRARWAGRKAPARSAAAPCRAPRPPPAKWPPCPGTGSRRRARRRRGRALPAAASSVICPWAIARADGLHLAGVLALLRQQRDAAGHQHAGQVARARQRHHHGRQALVAGGHADHAAGAWAASGSGGGRPMAASLR